MFTRPISTFRLGLTAAALCVVSFQPGAFPILVDASHATVVDAPVVIRADRQVARVHFERHDDDGDGFIDREEAESLPGVEESVYGADDFELIDTDADGQIDFQEFALYLSTEDADLMPLVSTDINNSEFGDDDVDTDVGLGNIDEDELSLEERERLEELEDELAQED